MEDLINGQPEQDIEHCATCIHAADSEDICILRKCKYAIAELKDCYEPERRWIPVTERLPIEEFKEGRENGTVYDIYPCLVTRYSIHTDEPRTRTYVCKSYFDGEDFMLNGGYAPNEGSDTENTLAWMPLPEPYKGEKHG